VGSISFANAASSGSGIDVQAMVDQAIQAASGPLQLMQQQLAQLSGQAAALNEIEGKLTALQTAMQALSDPLGPLAAMAATSSNPSIVTATANPGAAAGNHLVVVNALATTSSAYSAAFASATAPLNTGSFTLQVGSNAPVTVTVDSTNNTLSGLAATINGLNAGVTASVVTDAAGARLVLVSATSGTAGTISISNDTVGLGFTVNPGTDASLTVDGVPISSSSNQINGVIAGVTLNLQAAAPNTAVAISVAADTNAITTAIENFVSAYNAVVQDINSQFAVDPTTHTAGVLAGDSALRMVQEQLLNVVTTAVPVNGTTVNLESLGIHMQDDGTLQVDSGQLNGELTSNPGLVLGFFQNSTQTGFAQVFSNTLTALTDVTSGPLNVDLAGIQQMESTLNDDVANFQARLDLKRQQLLDEFSRVDAILRELPVLQQQIAQQLGTLP
jgi:flagellar hook-associated protein 2